MSAETPTNDAELTGTDVKDKTSFSLKMTVSRKILLVVFATTLVGLGLLVFLGVQSQRQNLEQLATNNNQTISELMAIQLSGALKWKKTDKIAEVYQEMASKGDTVLADIVTFDMDGNIVTEYHAEALPNASLDTLLAEHKGELAEGGIFTEKTDSHHIVLTPVTSAKGEVVGYAAIGWSLHQLNEQIATNLQDKLLVTVIALVGIMLLTGFLLNRFIGKPLSQLTDAMTQLANKGMQFL